MNLKTLAQTDETILLLGRTGTGKSFSAKKIHNESKRSQKKFIHVNCAAIADNLFESELFGHEKGSFTGALIAKQGYCSAVGGGTLFLDEIGELSLEKQAKLLILLEERTYLPVGSNSSEKFFGQIIMATNKNLEDEVEKGNFREDLLFRIRMFSLELDSLKDSGNLQVIIWDVINRNKLDHENFRIIFEQDLINLLISYDWPGNYRELNQTINYFFKLGKKKVGLLDAPKWIKTSCVIGTGVNPSLYHEALMTFEIDYLKRKMTQYQGRINLTSEMIGLSKATLISKLKKYGIDRRDYKIPNLGIASGL